LTDSQQTASQCHDVLQTDITVQPSINNCTEEYYSSGTQATQLIVLQMINYRIS